jgi:hypothetical protein
MIEWLALILLIPAILVPIVLLFGFAGCSFSHAYPVPPKPTDYTPPGDPDILDPDEPPIPETAFEATLTEDEQLANRCIVQRIEPVRLLKSGNQVRITLQRPTTGNLVIESISISHAVDPGSGDPYDSAGDPTLVPGPFPLLLATDPGNAAVELMPVSFALDRTKPLLLAFDIDTPGNVRRSATAPGTGVRAFVGPFGLHEAATGNRQPFIYQSQERTYLVQRIAVREV